MTKLTKVEELLKKGETYYANRVHIDIFGKGVIAGFHSRDDEVKKLRDALSNILDLKEDITNYYEPTQAWIYMAREIANKALEEIK